tara:strand:- start:354 stop:575 length:222 start_codon:yes stop_codon:yes gene_type:complete
MKSNLITFPKFKDNNRTFTDDRIKGLMTTNQVRDLFEIGNTTLHRWKNQKILSSVKVGGKLYFKGNEVEKLLK